MHQLYLEKIVHKVFMAKHEQLTRTYAVGARDNEVTVRWVPVHRGNEVADEYAKAAAIGGASGGEISGEEIPDGYLDETSSPI